MIFYFIPFILILISFYFKNNTELGDKRQIKFKSFLILITIIAGTRSEVGQDWFVYQNYFSSINITKTINDAWDTNNSAIFFEPGFFALNYFVKVIGFNYNFIPLLSCTLLNFSLYKISNEINGNKSFFLSVFFGYSFLILEFAQVRQSLSISLFLIAFSCYLKTKIF